MKYFINQATHGLLAWAAQTETGAGPGRRRLVTARQECESLVARGTAGNSEATDYELVEPGHHDIAELARDAGSQPRCRAAAECP